jgi:hypothetical protein
MQRSREACTVAGCPKSRCRLTCVRMQWVHWTNFALCPILPISCGDTGLGLFTLTVSSPRMDCRLQWTTLLSPLCWLGLASLTSKIWPFQLMTKSYDTDSRFCLCTFTCNQSSTSYARPRVYGECSVASCRLSIYLFVYLGLYSPLLDLFRFTYSPFLHSR